MKRRTRPGLALIFHAHLPWIRHEEHPDFLEERWLFEALRECYLPLLLVFERIASSGASFRAAVSLSPTLRAMWADPLLQRRFARYMEAAIEFAQRQCRELRDDARFHGPARHHLERARQVYAFWKDACRENPLGRFVELQRAGVLELFTTSATHALLPLYRDVPEAVRAQIMIGVDTFASDTGDHARGFWLPECAYHPDLDADLAASGARYTNLDTHGLTRAHPLAERGVFAPAGNARGFAFFARDPELTRRVWSAAEGYPGHPDYREFYRDLGHEVPESELGRAAGPAGIRVDSGMKLWRVTGGSAEKQPYRREDALARAREHAADFAARAADRARAAQESMDRPALLVAPFDAELFGHWWYEGPEWIEALTDAVEPAGLEFVTPSDWLERHPRLQMLEPAESSWGRGGAHEPWITPVNQWMRDGAAEAARRLVGLVRDSAASPKTAAARRAQDRALSQAARHVLLAMASDWPFMAAGGTAAEFARTAARDQLDRFDVIETMLHSRRVNSRTLQALEQLDPLFSPLDLRTYFR
ncbi:MAG: DUF1957 domain-containing protein [Kiritimatiellae bacterium]|nr:DUF1957 domain-containing protein [Kiritimatiellia bacterium]